MILRGDDKSPPGDVMGRPSVDALTVHRMAAGIDEDFLQCLREMRQRAEVLVIAGPLAC